MSFVNWIVNWFQSVFVGFPVWAQIVVVVVFLLAIVGIGLGILWIAYRIFLWFKVKISGWPTWLKAGVVTLVVFTILLTAVTGFFVQTDKLWIGNSGDIQMGWKFDSCGGACSVAPSATLTVTVTVPASTPLPPSATSTTTPVVPSATMPPSGS